jgi:hypothetical protein
MPNLDEFRVHPQAAGMYNSILTIAQDPAILSTAAGVWQQLHRTFLNMSQFSKKSVLSTTAFLFRDGFLANFATSAMAGTDLLHMVPTILEYSRFLARGAEGLDAKPRFAGGLSMLDLVTQAKERGLLTFSALQDGDTIGNLRSIGSSEEAINPRNLPNSLRYLAHSIKRDGIAAGLEYGTELIDNVAGGVAEKLHWAGGFMHDVSVLANLRTTLSTGIDTRMRQMVTGVAPSYRSFDEAAQHVQRYFFMYDEKGMLDVGMTRYIMPFWFYASRSLPAVYSDVLRNPQRFVAYQRAYAMINGEVREAGEDAPDGGFQAWTYWTY